MVVLNEEHWQDLWLEFSNDPRMWAYRASGLLLAGDVLHGPRKRGTDRGGGERKFRIARDGTLIGQMMMLYGMTLESLMKGVAAQRGHRFALEKDDGLLRYNALLKDDRHSHDLVRLARHVAIPLTIERKSLAKRLTPYITWGARYPAGKKWSDFVLEMSWDISNDHRIVHEFADSLFESLKVTRGVDGLVELPGA